MSTKKLLIIGAGFLQAYVIKKAKQLGYFTIAADRDETAPGRAFTDEFAACDIVDEEACLALAKEYRVDGVLTAATDYGVLTASRIAAELGLPGLDYSAALRIKNKFETRRRLYEAGADDMPPARLVKSAEDIAYAAYGLRFPVMVKPCDGSGSRGASRADNADELKTACFAAMQSSITGRATVESFVSGAEYGVESFVYGGEVHVLAVMRKKMTDPPFYAELGHAVPSGLDKGTEEKIRRSAKTAIEALGVNFGSVNMDLLLSPDGGVHIVDIGARMGGNLIGSHIVPLGTGVDYMANMIRAAVGDKVDFTPGEHGPVATRLLALTPGKVRSLPDFAAIEAEFGVNIEHHLAIGDTIRQYKNNLDGCGYIVACADTAEESERRAEAALDAVNRGIVRDV